MKFEKLGLNSEILEALSYMGFEEATPIQSQAIPLILDGKDLIACAQTGTGKTAAFILPILHKLTGNTKKGIKALVIAPTRELAIQIDNQIQGFSYFCGLSSLAVYGGGSGKDWEVQKKAMEQGVDIVVATPGKLLSHLNLGYVDGKTLEYLILDEADRMLDIGFFEDIMSIVSHFPGKKQTLLFSATMAPKIRNLSNKLLTDPEHISIAVSKPAEGVLQGAYLTYDAQKIPLVKSLIDNKPNYQSILIFCSTKRKVAEIRRILRNREYLVESISSDLEQSEREDVLSRFRTKQTRVLVATDVLSRGIDIKDINLVINFDVPGDAEDYVHRIGRTARASTTGVALTLINPLDMYKFKKIEDLIEAEVMKIPLPPELGKGPDYKTDKIPDNRGGGRKSGKGNYKGRNQKRR